GTRRDRGRHAGALAPIAGLRRLHRGRVREWRRAPHAPPRRRAHPWLVRGGHVAGDSHAPRPHRPDARPRSDPGRRARRLTSRPDASGYTGRVHVTVTTTKGAPDQPLEVARIAGEEMLPRLRRSGGFAGLLVLSHEEEGRTLVVTFWESRELADAHVAPPARVRDTPAPPARAHAE